MDQLLIIMKEFGIVVALLCVFLYWAYKKDQRQESRFDELGNRLNNVQDLQQTELMQLATRAIEAQERGTRVQEELIQDLRRRPCLKD